MKQVYTTNHGIPAYDAARWLAPPPAIRNVRTFKSGARCLVQIGASSLKDTTQEALVRDRVDNSFIIFPDGTHDFDLFLGRQAAQPRAAVGFVLMGPATKARWIARPTSTRMIQVHLPDAVLQDITAPTGRQISHEDFEKVPASLKPLFTAFASDCDRADTPALLLETYLSLIIQKLAFAKQSPERRGLSTAQYNKIVEYLNARPEQDVTLAGLAALVGFSPSHFARAFTASAGIPPHRFQIEMRIERAKKMLENTDLSIGEVAALSGYEDAGYFARLFRNEVGVTPMHYRRTIRL
jgi:AraC-like DNA-binding protein